MRRAATTMASAFAFYILVHFLTVPLRIQHCVHEGAKSNCASGGDDRSGKLICTKLPTVNNSGNSRLADISVSTDTPLLQNTESSAKAKDVLLKQTPLSLLRTYGHLNRPRRHISIVFTLVTADI